MSSTGGYLAFEGDTQQSKESHVANKEMHYSGGPPLQVLMEGRVVADFCVNLTKGDIFKKRSVRFTPMVCACKFWKSSRENLLTVDHYEVEFVQRGREVVRRELTGSFAGDRGAKKAVNRGEPAARNPWSGILSEEGADQMESTMDPIIETRETVRSNACLLIGARGNLINPGLGETA